MEMTKTTNETVVEIPAGRGFVRLTLDSASRGVLRGRIEVPSVKGCPGFDFTWRRGKYATPFVANVGGRGDVNAAKEFGARVLQAWADGVVTDSGGVGGSGACDPGYVSQLLVDGHVRRPCVVHNPDGTLSLRKATVVNPAKIADEEKRRSCLKVVAAWNALLDLYRGEAGDPLNFGQWFEQKMSG